jgi:hypothetical protein
MQKQQKTIQVELDEKAAEGIYSNFVLTGHTPSEFMLDFARFLPGNKKAKVYARIVMTPQSAKTLLMVLERTIKQYEGNFGEITLPQQNIKVDPTSIGFQPNLPGEEKKDKKKPH